MDDRDGLVELFENSRGHLRAVAYRMLGSLSEADDAVQETWLRLNRTDTDGVENLTGWLTTVVARVCLDMLRTRKSRREESMEEPPSAAFAADTPGDDPEREALLADSVGAALLVVLEKLSPAERVAFVLHDTFGLSFDEIARILGRSPAAARQLASRARRRVRGTPAAPPVALARQRELVQAFLSALRAGDFEGLVAVLDADAVLRAEGATPGQVTVAQGARTWARGAIQFSRAAAMAQLALINGEVGLIIAPHGRLFRALQFSIVDDRIARLEVIGDPARLRELDIALLSE